MVSAANETLIFISFKWYRRYSTQYSWSWIALYVRSRDPWRGTWITQSGCFRPRGTRSGNLLPWWPRWRRSPSQTSRLMQNDLFFVHYSENKRNKREGPDKKDIQRRGIIKTIWNEGAIKWQVFVQQTNKQTNNSMEIQNCKLTWIWIRLTWKSRNLK